MKYMNYASEHDKNSLITESQKPKKLCSLVDYFHSYFRITVYKRLAHHVQLVSASVSRDRAHLKNPDITNT